MVSVTSASRYHPRYQRRSSVYIRGLIPRNFAELAEAIQIVMYPSTYHEVILRFILGAFVCVTTSMSRAKSSWHWSVIHNQVTFWAWFGNVYIVQNNALFCLFDLILYASVSSYDHVETVNSQQHTCSWTSLTKRLTSTYTFAFD